LNRIRTSGGKLAGQQRAGMSLDNRENVVEIMSHAAASWPMDSIFAIAATAPQDSTVR